MTETRPEGLIPRSVSQDDRPCELHATHTPITVVNELHHAFPQEWQKDLWGEVRDKTLISMCATGHNNVHAAIRYFTKYGEVPAWCVGKTREAVLYAVASKAKAVKKS